MGGGGERKEIYIATDEYRGKEGGKTSIQQQVSTGYT